MTVNTTKLKDLLYEALQRNSPKDRAAFVEEHCCNESELKEMLESLIDAHEEAGDYLENPAIPIRKTEEVGTERPGSTISRYKLLEQIGEGGFGVVFMAKQEEPVRRKVALKIIKAGMDTKQVIARFEAERQALALMNHPNIAKVLDAGVTENGRPYFVMELVRGLPITKFCEENQLSVKERIELFLPVCQAIQHAHQKGIIHRDIKPTNVLVTLQLGSGQALNEGVPHLSSEARRAKGDAMVIDFGVAKAIDQRLTEKTLFTNFAQMIGTPAYMSPEQAEMSMQDVDTRSDVYSLGILLYELLTGTTPFPEERLKEVGYAEIQRIISEEEPERPSTVLSRLNGRFKTVAANRKCEPTALLRLIKGDLDWIVLKTIDKDRNRRYATPLELAADLQRHLANEPVTARSPSTIYKVKKFARRNRTVVIASLAVAVAAIIGLMGISWQAIRATKAQANAEAALRFVREDLLAQADPFLAKSGRSPNRHLKLLSAIQIATQGIEERYKDQPLVEADIRLTIGRALQRLGEMKPAETHLRAGWELFRRELGAENVKTFEADLAIAWLLLDQSKFHEAVVLIEKTLQGLQDYLGAKHKLTLQAMLCLGQCSLRTGKYDQAERLFQQVSEVAQDFSPPDVRLLLDAMFGLAAISFHRGNQEEAATLNREIIMTARRELGPDHPLTLNASIEGVNDFRNKLLRPREADDLAKEIYPRCVRVLGEEHPATLFLRSEMAILIATRGLNPLTEQKKVLEASEHAFGRNSLSAIFEQMRLGDSLSRRHYLKEGEELLKNSMERQHRLMGLDSSPSRWVMEWLAHNYVLQGQFAQAEELRRKVVEVDRHVLRPEDFWLSSHLLQLGYIYARQGKWQEAAPLFLEALSYPKSKALNYAEGLLVGWLAEDMDACHSIGPWALQLLTDTNDLKQAYEVALALLLVPAVIPGEEEAKVFKVVVRVLDSQSGSLRDSLLSGLAACRLAQWERATQTLAPLLKNPDGAIASLAGFLLAETQHGQGQVESARETLLAAEDRLERVLRAGDLGNAGAYGRGEWSPYVACIVARLEADKRINGIRKLLPIDAGYLSVKRDNWKPVGELLNQSYSMARRRQWDEAKDGLVRAMAHESFTWDSAHKQDPTLADKAAALFVLTGETAQYESLCRRLLTGSERGQLGFTAPAAYSPTYPLEDLRHQALAIAQWCSQESDPYQEQPYFFVHTLGKLGVLPLDSPTGQLKLGILQYRLGNYPAAAKSLQYVLPAYNLIQTGPAHAFAAMTAWRSGRATEARQLLAQAERLLDELQDGNPEDLGPAWQNAVLFEISMNEARSVIDEIPIP